MRTQMEIWTALYHHRDSLDEWREPDGLLLPTEPDADERQRIRLKLEASIWTLEWVLGER